LVGELLAAWQVGGARAGCRPFLHHISKSWAQTTRVIALKGRRSCLGCWRQMRWRRSWTAAGPAAVRCARCHRLILRGLSRV